MASRSDSSLRNARRKRFPIQEKREELEREVPVLQKRFGHELRVHECMERLHNLHHSPVSDVPNDLSIEVKELLIELATVEMEIARIESQIDELQSKAKNEKEAYIESVQLKVEKEAYIESVQLKVRKHEAQKIYQETSPASSNTNNRKPSKKVTFEAKALHFITKAIKGDYNKRSDLGTKDKSMNLKESLIQKDNDFYDGGTSFREKVLSRTGIFKTPSSLKEPRHPTPWRGRRHETLMDIPTKILSTPLNSQEESINKWSPNKLSENIMRCLIFIFVRMHRTSRATELEKSGPIARSTFLSLSFRAETSSKSNSGSIFQKDSRQQDPYGIFHTEDSIPRDIGPYKNLVRFMSSSIDLKCIRNSSSAPLFQKLKTLMDGLGNVDLRFLSHQQKLAFWINLYNACIMHGFLRYGVPQNSSPEKLFALINKATLDIGGYTMNAQVIERFILRKPPESLVKEIVDKRGKDAKELIVHDLYGLETLDPNIVFALCYGTRSSPAVKIYTAESVTSELERSKQEYLQAAIMVTKAKRILLPELLVWNMQDFAADLVSLVEWVCRQLPTFSSLRKSMVECCFRGGKAAVVEKMPYEFEFQLLLPYER